MRILDLARVLRFFGYTMKYASLMTKPTEWYFPLEEGQNKRKRCCRVFGNIRHSNNDHLQSYNRDNKLFYTKYCQFYKFCLNFFQLNILYLPFSSFTLFQNWDKRERRLFKITALPRKICYSLVLYFEQHFLLKLVKRRVKFLSRFYP